MRTENKADKQRVVEVPTLGLYSVNKYQLNQKFLNHSKHLIYILCDITYGILACTWWSDSRVVMHNSKSFDVHGDSCRHLSSDEAADQNETDAVALLACPRHFRWHSGGHMQDTSPLVNGADGQDHSRDPRHGREVTVPIFTHTEGTPGGLTATSLLLHGGEAGTDHGPVTYFFSTRERLRRRHCLGKAGKGFGNCTVLVNTGEGRERLRPLLLL